MSITFFNTQFHTILKSYLNYIILFLFICFTGIYLGLTTIDGKATVAPENNNEYQLVWADEFDYEGLPNPDKWSYDVGDACDKPAGCGWGNHELQYYTDAMEKNARVQNGHLTIEVHKEKIANSEYSSARLVTKGKGDWKYGKIDIKAQLPKGLGVWSAIWMLSSEDRYKGWPHSGEIDIMENVGYEPDVIYGTAHTLAYHHSIGTHKSDSIIMEDVHNQFHVYSVEWMPDHYTVSVDDKPFFTFENEGSGFEAWPFDQKFHLILNIAFGGDWGGKMGINDTALPAKMNIDYVRVYQKNNYE